MSRHQNWDRAELDGEEGDGVRDDGGGGKDNVFLWDSL